MNRRHDPQPETTPTSWQPIVDALGLRPHPEGGHYREVFRSEDEVQARGALRSAGTSIYYLLADAAYSAWHRIDADELWYFHAGSPLMLHVLQPDGELATHRLGDPLRHGDAVFQAVVPAGCWFAAELEHAADFALVGCAVMPGFEFSGFQLAGAGDLAAAVERHGDWIHRLLR